MAKLPKPMHSTEAKIDALIESKQGLPRTHFGASMLGAKCERWLWLNFRWAVIQKFPGRILRLFQRGHDEEKKVVKWLQDIGMIITDSELHGSQRRVSFGNHVSGSLDGIIHSGVPGAENTKHILEIKTHNLKSFNDLTKHAVQKSKPVHYAQMQVYMYGSGIDRALYVAVCKDNDELYTERVHLDESLALHYIERGKRIAVSDRMPEPLSADATYYECKMCPAHKFCHKSKLTKEVNCRTCCHATAREDNTWFCERHKDIIPEDFQRTGCRSHVLHVDMVPWRQGMAVGEWSLDYEGVINGEDGRESSELIANHAACKDDFANKLIAKFDGAKIVG